MTRIVFVLSLICGLGAWLAVVAIVVPRKISLVMTYISDQDRKRKIRSFDSLKKVLAQVKDKLAMRLEVNPIVVQDAHMIGRTIESHTLIKLVGMVMGMALMAIGGWLLSILATPYIAERTDLNFQLLIVIVCVGLGVLLGWWLPDSMLHTEAEKEREYFQQVTEAWLELVGQLVTAGEDTFSALITATAYSKHPVFAVLRSELRLASASAQPPWVGLRKLADDRCLRFLDPFCAALELAGTTGASARQAILTQVEAAQSKAMHEADAVAASSSEKMGAPLALIGGSFMILMGYPPMANILDTATLTGPGLGT